MDSDSEKPTLETTKVPPPPAEPVYIDADKIPDSDEISIEFLNLIVKNDLRYLEFDENLSIYSLDGDEIGTFFISVKPFVYKRENCFKVVVKSSTLLEDNTFKTEINALVDFDLNTIEQECIENHLLPNGEQVETKITLVLNDEANEYILTKKEKDKKEIKKSVVRIRTSLMDGYISESSNILLQRLMIQLNRFDEITLFTFDSNLNPVKVSYRPLDNRFIKLDDEEIEIRGVERKMNSYSDVPTIWHVYFSSDGHMINRVQIGFPAIIRATETPPKIDIDEYMPKITIPKKELNWEEDMQMKSKYIDRKEELKNDYDQYLKDHPEVKSLMADFMQSILIAKPNDVVAYSARYFAPYSAHTKPNQFYPSYSKTINIPKHQDPN